MSLLRGWTCPTRYTLELFQFAEYRCNQTRGANNANATTLIKAMRNEQNKQGKY